jgi:hypothetical protein
LCYNVVEANNSWLRSVIRHTLSGFKGGGVSGVA